MESEPVPDRPESGTASQAPDPSATPEPPDSGATPPPSASGTTSERSDSGDPSADCLGPSAAPSESPPTRRQRMRAFWARHRTIFWMVHSVWALATGVAVVLLARERYAFIPWVVVFLGVTWASTLFFGRAPDDEEGPATPGLGQELTSYLTRTLYQETLFFLLPFYAYSTVLGSPNMLFLGLLGGFAVLSCLDLLFDRWLRTKAVFGMLFFSTVAFAALDLLLPMVFGMSPFWATPVAAVAAVASALPLAWRPGAASPGSRARSALVGVGMLVLILGVPEVVPPVPLRLQEATFATDIDPETLAVVPVDGEVVERGALQGRLVVLFRVFAPANVPARVQVEWKRDGETVKRSRLIEILAHESAFRVWDALREDLTPVLPGDYEVILSTADGGVFGRAAVTVAGS